MIIFLTKDLLVQSQASAAAKQSDAKIKFVSDLTRAIAQLQDPASGAGALIVDLQTPGLQVDQLIQQLEAVELKINTVAFAQHVLVDLLASAKSDAINQVLTRGQFVSQLPAIISELIHKEA